jgi:hypothetical protein
MVVPQGVSKFRQAVVNKLEAEKDKLTPYGLTGCEFRSIYSSL